MFRYGKKTTQKYKPLDLNPIVDREGQDHSTTRNLLQRDAHLMLFLPRNDIAALPETDVTLRY